MVAKKKVTKRLSHEEFEPSKRTARARLSQGEGKRKDVKKLGTAGRVVKAKARAGDPSAVPEVPALSGRKRNPGKNPLK